MACHHDERDGEEEQRADDGPDGGGPVAAHGRLDDAERVGEEDDAGDDQRGDLGAGLRLIEHVGALEVQPLEGRERAGQESVGDGVGDGGHDEQEVEELIDALAAEGHGQHEDGDDAALDPQGVLQGSGLGIDLLDPFGPQTLGGALDGGLQRGVHALEDAARGAAEENEADDAGEPVGDGQGRSLGSAEAGRQGEAEVLHDDDGGVAHVDLAAEFRPVCEHAADKDAQAVCSWLVKKQQ